MKEYIESKMKIFNNQDKDRFAVCSKDIYGNITKNNLDKLNHLFALVAEATIQKKTLKLLNK